MEAASEMGEGFLGLIASTIILQTIAVVKFCPHYAILSSKQQWNIERLMPEPIPFLSFVCLIVLTVLLWRHFRDR
jgi:hypothetical protein